uniref:PB1 domain-containing protein n=1 Tax=Nelumbo nucifera TaxID=4432 RepID=A0A822XV00_NELNU|nr:TPA_asm: hypothetical protein HUJ06_024229 [Nelumbo nucifera]
MDSVADNSIFCICSFNGESVGIITDETKEFDSFVLDICSSFGINPRDVKICYTIQCKEKCTLKLRNQNDVQTLIWFNTKTLNITVLLNEPTRDVGYWNDYGELDFDDNDHNMHTRVGSNGMSDSGSMAATTSLGLITRGASVRRRGSISDYLV